MSKDPAWAHYKVVEVGPGYVTLEFVSERNFASCFEYRADGVTNDAVNPNDDITDGYYPYTCVNNSSAKATVPASEYVEVRMVFGAETDERFDWTRVDVLGADACKDSGWMAYGFKNQGECIQFVNTGKDSRP
jgi:hypothetical protein